MKDRPTDANIRATLAAEEIEEADCSAREEWNRWCEACAEVNAREAAERYREEAMHAADAIAERAEMHERLDEAKINLTVNAVCGKLPA